MDFPLVSETGAQTLFEFFERAGSSKNLVQAGEPAANLF